jgi:hypothetical protein
MSIAPIVIAEDDRVHAALTAEVLGAGWRIAVDVEDDPDLVVALTVHEPADAKRVVLTALDGTGVLVRADAPPLVVDDLVDDLRRIRPVLVANADTVVPLETETWRLLHSLVHGATLAVAARSLHMSSRTANRRITGARDVFGVTSRAQLLGAVRGPFRVPTATSVTNRWRPASG